ncbi:hypothetical protein BKA63DRAFT_154887 [Paraphoma chrysanthemicola]|nr:hypothetical protein BKA63DRAFT_154887 [Paraphoma chrysanthemicola]
MDPASLAFGVAGFAFQFFTAAQEGYEIIQAAKAIGETASRLHTLMGFEYVKFDAWARVVGLTDADTEFEEQMKGDQLMYQLIMQALCHICNDLTHFNELNSKYGFQKEERNRLSNLLQRKGKDEDNDDDTGNRTLTIPNLMTDDALVVFEDVLCIFRKRLSYMKKTKWAIKDKAKYEQLVSHMSKMNNGLYFSLSRTKQSLASRDMVARPRNLTLSPNMEPTDSFSATFHDYYNAEIFKQRAMRQARLEKDFLSSRKPIISEAFLETLTLQTTSITPAKQNIARVLKIQSGKVNQKVLVEYKMVQAKEPGTEENTVLFNRLINLMDLLSVTPKPSQYRILDCIGFIRHDLGSDERYGLVFRLPPRLAAQPQLRQSTLQEFLRAREDNTPPGAFPLEHRFRLAARIANSIAYMHFAGWLHRNLSSDSIICFHTEDNPSISEPFLSGFAYARLDNPREVSEYDVNTTSNLYRHPSYQMPNPSTKFERSYDIYSLGIILIEIGLWKQIRAFWNEKKTAAAFKNDLVNRMIPLLGFYMGQRYMDAAMKCLTVEKWDVQGDDERLSSQFSRTVVHELESCEMK